MANGAEIKRHRLNLWLILALFAVSGLVAGLSTRIVQAALTRSAVQDVFPTVVATPVTPPVNTPLAHDTFRRPDQALWGIASDGQQWDGDANRLATFAIANGAGLIAGGREPVQAVLGPVAADTQVSVSGSVNHFGGGVNFGVVLRWSNAANWYKAYIDGSRLVMLKRVDGVSRQMGQMTFIAQDHVSYTLRFRAAGAALSANVWPSAALEPGGWLMNRSDSSLFAGQGGVRMVLNASTIVSVTAFLETRVG